MARREDRASGIGVVEEHDRRRDRQHPLRHHRAVRQRFRGAPLMKSDRLTALEWGLIVALIAVAVIATWRDLST